MDKIHREISWSDELRLSVILYTVGCLSIGSDTKGNKVQL